MATSSRPLLLDDEQGTQSQGAWVASLRFFLRVINLILAVLGCAMFVFAGYVFLDVRREGTLKGLPWFIIAFAVAGLFIVITASTALIGVAHNNGFCLGLYSFLMVVLLIGQAALAVAFFADESWKKLLPHDDTGEAKKMAKYLQQRVNVVRWVGLGALIVQVFSVLLAYALSSAQQRLLEEISDEEDEIWGRRVAPAPTGHGHSPEESLESGQSGRSQRQDPWSQRMRSKYGLDVDSFTYDPQSLNRQQAAAVSAAQAPQQRSKCAIM